MNWGLLLLALIVTSCEKVKDDHAGQWVRGLTINGEVSSCLKADPDLVCSEEFTEGDQFAIDCEENGNTAVACGCHEYLCASPGSEKVEPKSGHNSDGLASSCLPMAEEKLCSTEYTEEDAFADECEEAGFEVSQCGCDSYLCSEKI